MKNAYRKNKKNSKEILIKTDRLFMCRLRPTAMETPCVSEDCPPGQSPAHGYAGLMDLFKILLQSYNMIQNSRKIWTVASDTAVYILCPVLIIGLSGL